MPSTCTLFLFCVTAVSSTTWNKYVLPPEEWDSSKCGNGISLIKKQALSLEQCTEAAIGATRTQLETEVFEAYITNTIANLLVKYCEKFTVVVPCMDKFSESIAHCLKDKHKVYLPLAIRAIEAGANFLCTKQATRIVNFVTEGGATCTYSKLSEIGKCLKLVFQVHSILSVQFLLNMTFDDAACPRYNAAVDCFKQSLGLCSSPTTLDTVEDTTGAMLKATPCAKMAETRIIALSSATNNRPNKWPSVISTTFWLLALKFLLV